MDMRPACRQQRSSRCQSASAAIGHSRSSSWALPPGGGGVRKNIKGPNPRRARNETLAADNYDFPLGIEFANASGRFRLRYRDSRTLLAYSAAFGTTFLVIVVSLRLHSRARGVADPIESKQAVVLAAGQPLPSIGEFLRATVRGRPGQLPITSLADCYLVSRHQGESYS
jgi:hypothetical protein